MEESYPKWNMDDWNLLLRYSIIIIIIIIMVLFNIEWCQATFENVPICDTKSVPPVLVDNCPL